MNTFPIAIIEDRYTGAYSGGRWLAIAMADVSEGQHSTRVSAMLAEGPFGQDCDAMDFWENPPDWIAVGHTPTDAFTELQNKLDDG